MLVTYSLSKLEVRDHNVAYMLIMLYLYGYNKDRTGDLQLLNRFLRNRNRFLISIYFDETTLFSCPLC